MLSASFSILPDIVDTVPYLHEMIPIGTATVGGLRALETKRKAAKILKAISDVLPIDLAQQRAPHENMPLAVIL